MAAADALDRAPERGEERLNQRRRKPAGTQSRLNGQRSCNASQSPLATMIAMPSADQ